MLELFKQTVAYKILTGDKNRGELSHAYALVCDDEVALRYFVPIVAKIILCEDQSCCDVCRHCRLIDKRSHSDVSFYPKNVGGKILTEDISEVLSQTHIKPIESDKRVFAFVNTSTMNTAAQNKLLKTLEEPPKGVFLVLGVENENILLSTVKSRVKKLEIPPFSAEQLKVGLKDNCPDKSKLESAITLADGKIGKVLEYYGDDKTWQTENLVYNLLEQMKSSREVSSFACKIDKDNIKEVLICLKRVFSEIVRGETLGFKNAKVEQLSKIYKCASAIAIIEKINLLERALFFNGNVNMITDNLLLCILEEKYRWQKL
ncbi:MAG: hypothetical protein IKJ19_02065 [Clostridia bacterium]|nr:hypothetical protein [Clostridia bacterium]